MEAIVGWGVRSRGVGRGAGRLKKEPMLSFPQCHSITLQAALAGPHEHEDNHVFRKLCSLTGDNSFFNGDLKHCLQHASALEYATHESASPLLTNNHILFNRKPQGL